MLTAERLIELFGPVPERGLLVKCPCHNDRTASLHVRIHNGKPLLHCFAGCSFVALSKALQGNYTPENVSTMKRNERPIPTVRFHPNVTDQNIWRLEKRIGTPLKRYPKDNLMYLSRFGVQSVLVFDPLFGGQMMPLSPEGRYGQVKKLTLPGTNCKKPLFLGQKEHDSVLISEGISDFLAIYAQPDRFYDVCCVLGASHRPSVDDMSALLSYETVLLGFDNDDAGDKACLHYLKILYNAKRWQPKGYNDWRDAICAKYPLT